MPRKKAAAKTIQTRQQVASIPTATLKDAAPQGKGAKADAIYERIDRLVDKYANLHAQDEVYEDLYHLEVATEPEVGEETVISSKPLDVVNLANDLIATNIPLIDVPPVSETHKDELEADTAEKFLLAAWNTWIRRGAVPIIRQWGHDANLLGRAIGRVTYDADIEDELPVRLQVRDPKVCSPEFDEDGRLFGMAERYDKSAGDIRRLLPDVDLPKDANDNELDDDALLEWSEWWDAVRYVYFVEGKEVYRDEHHYGFMPYVFGYGRTVRSEKPERQVISILKGIRHTAPAYNRLLSAELTAVIANVFSAWTFTSERGDTFTPDLTYGAINSIFPNEKLEPLQRQGELADLQGVKSTLRDEMDNTTFRAMLGQADASSGYAFSQVTRGEKLKINPVKQSLDVMLSQVFEKTLKLIAAGGKKVRLYVPRLPGISDYGFTGFAEMTPQMARKHKQVYVSIPPDYLTDQQANTSLALQATAGQTPLLDRDTARRTYLGQTDTTRIEQRIIEEKRFLHG